MRIKLIFYIFFIGAIGEMGLYGGESFEEFIEKALHEEKVRKVSVEQAINEMESREVLKRLKRIEEILKAIEKGKEMDEKNRTIKEMDEKNRTIRGSYRSNKSNKRLGSKVRLEGRGHLNTDLRVIHKEAFKK